MCGIAGIFPFRSFGKASLIKSMADALQHRGPDDEGFLAVNSVENQVYPLVGSVSKVEGKLVGSFDKPSNLLLAHRRLSIIDPSPAGHQPMSNSSGLVWIIYNGEIYNYIELREQLKTLGCSFKTNTDTEVILAAYEVWDKDCVEKLNGMWAFVIYDRRRNILFASRDRFGVKPLYYCRDENYFAFASEIKALLKLPFLKKGINPSAVFDYLVFSSVENEEEGFFEGICELLPSHNFELNLGTAGFKKWKYYSLSCVDSWEKFDGKKVEEYSNIIRELIFNAIELRLRSDVPIGSCLSGGLDSSTVVCVVNELLKRESIAQIGERQKVFTASYGNEGVDESKWAQCVVDATKTSWYQTFPGAEELFEDLENLVYVQEMPFNSTSIYAQYRVMKLARENGVRVLLDGQGGDELFAGYASYYRLLFVEMLKNFALWPSMREFNHMGNAPINARTLLISLIYLLAMLWIPRAIKTKAVKIGAMGNNYLNPDFWNDYKWRLELFRDNNFSSLNRTLHGHMGGPNLKTLLRYEDRNSMAFSVEARTPFADDVHLIEYVFQIPSVYKIYNGWSKYLLRKSIRGLIPEEIRQRKDKIGFATPEARWLTEKANELKAYLGRDLSDFFDVEKVKTDWDRFLKGGARSGIIWRFINLAVWRQVFGM